MTRAELYSQVTLIVIGAILTGVIGLGFWRVQRRIEKNEDKREARADEKSKQDKEVHKVILQSLQATGDLTHATAVAVIDGKVNGVMDAALKKHKAAAADLNNFLLGAAANNLGN